MKTKRQRMLQYFKSQIQNLKVTDFVYITIKIIHGKIFMKYARKMHISKASLFLLSGIKSSSHLLPIFFMARSTKGFICCSFPFLAIRPHPKFFMHHLQFIGYKTNSLKYLLYLVSLKQKLRYFLLSCMHHKQLNNYRKQ